MGHYSLHNFLCFLGRTLCLPRTLFAKVPHHISQGRNRREDIFLSTVETEIYLEWLTS